jgi:hypothetical protein
VADCKLATTANMNEIARLGGRFITVLPAMEIGLQIGPTSGEKSACKSDPPYWTLESACLLGSFEVKNADSGRIRSDTSCSS